LGSPTLLRALGALAVLLSAAVQPGCGSGRADTGGGAPSADLRVEAKAVEDVFLLSGELRAVRSFPLTTPRGGEREMQIRWMVDDGAEVKEGERIVEFDAARLIQTIEERRLKLRQAQNERESRERSAAAEGERKRVAVDKAEVEADKARLDAVVPAELRAAVDYRRFQATWQEKKAALDKAKLERDAYAVSSQAEIRTARAAEEKAERDVAAAEKALASMSLFAPRSGIFLVGNFWMWGPEGPRKLQPGDTVWSGFLVGTIPDPSEMEVQIALAEADHGRIAPGMEARCILDTYPDRVFEGRVEEVGSVSRESTGRGFFASAFKPGFPVRVSLAKSDPLMRPGLSVRVEVVRGAWPKALSVPRGAVRFEKDGPLVRRQGGGTTRVKLVACTPLECVVESGLAEGDRVAFF
jgi:multidrug efflux pump subunit AcrA (membrane-fusion protein)